MLADPNTQTTAPALLRAKGDLFARLGGLIGQLEDKERAGVYSTAHRHTAFLDSPEIMAATSRSSFDLEELRQGNVSLYIVLPPPRLEAQGRFLRMLIAAIIRLIGERGMAPGKELLMVLDEIGQIGHMPAMETGLTLLRGFSLKMCFVWQSVSQLKSVFKDSEGVLMDNTDVQVYFGTQSFSTGELVSKMLGHESITVESASANEGDNRSWQEGQQARPAGEVRRGRDSLGRKKSGHS